MSECPQIDISNFSHIFCELLDCDNFAELISKCQFQSEVMANK